jgi:hypothetical protein
MLEIWDSRWFRYSSAYKFKEIVHLIVPVSVGKLIQKHEGRWGNSDNARVKSRVQHIKLCIATATVLALKRLFSTKTK